MENFFKPTTKLQIAAKCRLFDHFKKLFSVNLVLTTKVVAQFITRIKKAKDIAKRKKTPHF